MLAVYNFVQVPNTNQIIEALCGEYLEQDHFQIVSNSQFNSVRDIVHHHRTAHCEVVDIGSLEPHYFLVVDRTPPFEKGVLLVNDNYKGAYDAVRMPLNDEIALFANALVVGTTGWGSIRDQQPTEETKPLYPLNKLAVYNTLSDPSAVPTGFRKPISELILSILQDGLYRRGLNFKEGNRSKECYDCSHREIYVGIPAPDKTVAQVVAGHSKLAQREGLEVNMFAVADDEWKRQGLIFVRLGPPDQFRHSGLKMGELLNWIWLGLIKWEEAREENVLDFDSDDNIYDM